jgi:hypothetical protein
MEIVECQLFSSGTGYLLISTLGGQSKKNACGSCSQISVVAKTDVVMAF